MKFILFLGFMSFHIAEKGGIYCEHKKATFFAYSCCAQEGFLI